MSDNLNISPITLGLLYEQITACSKENDPKKFWPYAFSHLRWILPYVRMVFLCKGEDTFTINQLYEHGVIYDKDDKLIGRQASSQIKPIISTSNVKWIAKPEEKLDALLANNDELVTWLLEPKNIDDVLLAPIAHGNRQFGLLIFSLRNVSDSDKVLLSTIISIFASYLYMNYTLISELAVKKEREEELLRSESVRAKLAKLNNDLERKIDIFNKFVPVEFLNMLGVDKETDYIELGYNKPRNITILFSDIRSFTALSDRMSSDKVFKFVNDYLSIIVPKIVKHNGFIDKYIGDAIMAIFSSPDDAIKASIDMMRALSSYNKHRINEGKEKINIGIGINTGQTSMGTIGFANHIETTVIGSTVNVAARLESLSKQYKLPIIISNTTASLLNKNDFSLRYLDYVKVRGIKESVDIYELLNHLPSKEQQTKENMSDKYQLAVEEYHQGEYEEARRLFEHCQKLLPDDIAIQQYLKLLGG